MPVEQELQIPKEMHTLGDRVSELLKTVGELEMRLSSVHHKFDGIESGSTGPDDRVLLALEIGKVSDRVDEARLRLTGILSRLEL